MANDLEKKIVKQIEYYFGDINLPRDKFLKETIEKTEGGWVNLDVLLTFKRLADLSKDKEVIATAVANSELVEVSEDKDKLRRNVNKPLPDITEEEYNEKMLVRTAYVKGLPKDETFDNIMEFISTFGAVDSLRMRYYKDKATDMNKFKGSCNIIFATEDDCKKFLETEDVKYKDAELKRQTQKVFLQEKKEEYENRKNKKNKKSGEESANMKEKSVKKENIDFPEKTIIKLVCDKAAEELNWSSIKAKVLEISELQLRHVDFNPGEKEGFGRFPNANEAEKFFNKITDGKFTVGEVEFTVSLVDKDGEQEYYKTWRERSSKKKNNFHNKGFNKYGRKRKGNFTRDGPQAKKESA